MADFRIEIKGANELQRALRDYPRAATPILQRAIVAVGAVFAKHTLRNDPVPFRTGNLLQSFRFRTGRLVARWFPTAHYAPHVEFGTQPHPIFPVNASVLAFSVGGQAGYVTSRSGREYYRSRPGTMVFAARVNHPGTRAKPFMQKIVRKSQRDVEKLFGQALDQINKSVAKETRT